MARSRKSELVRIFQNLAGLSRVLSPLLLNILVDGLARAVRDASRDASPANSVIVVHSAGNLQTSERMLDFMQRHEKDKIVHREFPKSSV